MFQQFVAIDCILRSPFCIFNPILLKQSLHQSGYLTFSLSLSPVFHFIKHITHIMWASFPVIGSGIVCFFKAIVIRHDTQQLKRFLHMGQFLRTGNIIAVLPFLHKVICNDFEIALE